MKEVEERGRRFAEPGGGVGDGSASYIYIGSREGYIGSREGAGPRETRLALARTEELEVVTGEVIEADDPRGVSELLLTRRLPRDRHPVLVYLASLAEGSRRTMRASLETIAEFVSQGEPTP